MIKHVQVTADAQAHSLCLRVSGRWLVGQSPEICTVSDVSENQPNRCVSTIQVDQFHVISKEILQ